jgi:hypothetical protein
MGLQCFFIADSCKPEDKPKDSCSWWFCSKTRISNSDITWKCQLFKWSIDNNNTKASPIYVLWKHLKQILLSIVLLPVDDKWVIKERKMPTNADSYLIDTKTSKYICLYLFSNSSNSLNINYSLTDCCVKTFSFI